MPSDFKINTLNIYEKQNREYPDCVYETYGSSSSFDLGGGRNKKILPSVSLGKLQKYIETSRKMGIQFNYTLNSSSIGKHETSPSFINNVLQFVEQLLKIGVDQITVAIPFLIEVLHRHFPQLEIVGSVVSRIDNPIKAEQYVNLGVKRITVSEDVCRNFNILEAISDIAPHGVEVLVNSICLYQCPFREFHRNSTSHNKSPNPWFYLCRQKFIQDPVEVLKARGIIRPEDIGLYEERGIEYFKVVGREYPKIHPDYQFWNVSESYLKRRYDGNLVRLLLNFAKTGFDTLSIDNHKLEGFLEPWLKGKAPCLKSNYCLSCGHCHSYYKKSLIKEFSSYYFYQVKKIYKKSFGETDFCTLKDYYYKIGI